MSYEVAAIYNQALDDAELPELGKLTEVELRERFKYLSYDDQSLLWLNVQANWLEDYTITSADPKAVSEVVAEAMHGDLDGWKEDQKVVIRAFLADIAYAAKHWS